MAYNPHTLLTFHGILGAEATAEQTWSFGIRFPANQGFWAGFVADGGSLTTVATDLMGAFTDNYTPENFSNSVWLFGVKMAILDAAGHYVAPPTEVVYDLDAAFGTSLQHRPFQDTIVTTFRHTGIGRGNFGRVYLPSPAASTDQTGLMDAVVAANLADLAQGWINDTNVVLAALDPDFTVSIFSRGAGTTKHVDSVGVGRVYDTQRRRRDKLVEATTYRSIT